MSTRTALTVVGAVVGAVVGYYTGNIALGVQIGTAIGGLAGNAIDPVKIYGPRLSDAKLQLARDGVSIPWGLGRFRVTGTVIACQPGPPTEHKTNVRQDKGGPVSVEYSYTRTHAILICEGPILGIRRIWRDNKLVYDTTEVPTTANSGLTGSPLAAAVSAWQQLRASATSFASKARIYLGDETQLPNSELEALFGAGNVPAHRGTAYMVVVDDDVTNRQGSIPQYDFEVVTAGSLEGVDSFGGNSQWVRSISSSEAIFTNNNATMEAQVGTLFYDCARTNAGRSAGMLYFETLEFTVGGAVCSGVCNGGVDTRLGAGPDTAVGGGTWTLATNGFALSNLGAIPGNFSPALTNPSVLMHAVDLDTGKYYFGRNGVWTGNPAAGTGAVYTSVAGIVYPATFIGFPGICTIRLRSDEFDYAIPTGFSAWGPANGTVIPDAPIFSTDEDGNLIYDGSTPIPDSVLPDAPTVEDALNLIASRAGLDADMYDFSAMADEVIEGFFIAREAQGDAVLSAVAQAYFFDYSEFDGKIRAVKRGADSVLTLTVNDLAAQDGSPVTENREQDIERPRKLNVVYADPVMNYIPTKQTAERLSTTISAIGERSIELAIVMGKDQAAQIADKAIKVTWTDLLGTVVFDMPESFSYLTTTDVIILSYRSKNQRLRIESVKLESGRLSVTCRQDSQRAYTSDVEGIGTPPDPPGSGLLGATRFEFINTYPLRDADDKFGFYVAAAGVFAGWPGCYIQWSIDSGASWVNGPIITTGAVIGEVVSGIPDASPFYLDEGNTLRVNVGSSTLASVTREQLLQEQNSAIVGDEVIQFQTATLVSNGVYDLTVLARGRLGTDTTAHVAGERFVMLDGAYFIETDSSLLGKQIKVRAVTSGTDPDNNTTYDEDFTTAYIQDELPPYCLIGYRYATGVSLYWSGQGRLGTPAQSFQGTKFTGYTITFSSGGTSVSKAAPGTSYIYTTADQTTDFGSPPASLTVSIVANNSITGASTALTGTV